MTASRYEKYVVRKTIPPETGIKWGLPELGIVDLHFFLRPNGPVKEANTMLEFAWIVKDSAFGVTEDKPPHAHPCDEIFIFMGSNPEDPEELGAEIEFWMGEGEDTEVIRLNTSGLVFVPGGLVHLPLFFKNVRRPLVWTVLALNVGRTLESNVKHPVRGI